MMTIATSKVDCIPIFHYGTYLAENRERLVSKARENSCTHMFSLDYDMVFDQLTLSLLLANDKDIVTVPYNYRRLPKETMVKTFDGMKESLFKVFGSPLGCSLIKMSVFDKLEKPYFPLETNKNGDVIVGEDIGFCIKARKAGFDIWCDPTIKIKHLGEYAY